MKIHVALLVGWRVLNLAPIVYTAVSMVYTCRRNYSSGDLSVADIVVTGSVHKVVSVG